MNHPPHSRLMFLASVLLVGCGPSGDPKGSAPAKGTEEAAAPAKGGSEAAAPAPAPAENAGGGEAKKSGGKVSGDLTPSGGTIHFEGKLTECVIDGSNAKVSGENFELEYKDWVGTLKATYEGGTLDGVIDAKASVSAAGNLVTTQGSANGVGWNLKITCD